MAKVTTIECPFLTVEQKDLSFVLTRLPAWALVEISYVSIRGVHEEEGAVQRYLNPRRISSIRDFTLEVGIFPSCFILNWTNSKIKIDRKNALMHIPVVQRSAQVIDGQHRRAGIASAIRANPKMKDFQIPIAIFENLDTARCADIFISINTEQKPVPKSLVYDLFSEASEHIADHGIQRAADIAKFLDEENESPYLQLIKFPGSRYERGGIALSTAVSALKPMVEEKGDFDQVRISNLNEQSALILRFCQCLAKPYSDHWLDASNAFLYASGFIGAMEFFRKRVIPFCVKRRSFKSEIMQKCIGVNEDSLILQSEVKGTGGKNAASHVYDRLNDAFDIEGSEEHEFEI